MITIQAETPVIRASAGGTFARAARTSKVVLVDGIHDLGGMQGFGAVGHSPAEPAFHHRWEAVARALLVVVAGAVKVSGGEFRHSIERMEPGHYLTSSYYEHWLTAAATLAVEHGLVTRSELEARAGFIEEITSRYEAEIGPMNGAKVVARAWVDPRYKERLLADGTAAIAELGFGGPEGDHMVVGENTPGIHNVIVCTLCSCYPWPVLGLPPAWYKDPPYRARMVREPRTLLAEMGCPLPEDAEIRVWDSSAEVRYLVLPERPLGTDGRTEAELGGLVTRDSMIGVARL